MRKIKFCLTLILAVMSMAAARAEVTWQLTPEPGTNVTDLSVLNIAFSGISTLTYPKVETIDARLVNEDTGETYKCVSFEYNWNTMADVSIKFGIEGTSTPASVTSSGTYKLTIGAGSFKGSYKTDAGDWDTYYCPVMEATYTIGAGETNSMSNYVLTPAAGTVTSFPSIKIDFPDTGFNGIEVLDINGVTLTATGGSYSQPTLFKVVKTEGNYNTFCTMYFDYADATVPQPMTIAAPGNYRLDIPAGTFREDDRFATDKAENAAITAYFEIASEAGNGMSQASFSPKAGTVESIGNVQIIFGGNGGGFQLPAADDWSKITIKEKGEYGKTYTCVSISSTDLRSNSALMQFAPEGSADPVTITRKGEYLLEIPAGLFSGITGTSGNRRMTNDAMAVLYTINPSGYTFTCEASGNGTIEAWTDYDPATNNPTGTQIEQGGPVEAGSILFLYLIPGKVTDSTFESITAFEMEYDSEILSLEDLKFFADQFEANPNGLMVSLFSVQDIHAKAVFSNNLAGITDILFNPAAGTVELFNLSGERVNAENLSTGIYLMRQAGATKKVLIRK
ncbi:MAG: hypothetical protein NC338_05660 [Firmicutes bacterium]|nr:hypothetical protein [Bacillota bacterium]MCM1401586.1 hypothetical protein [Bacteroides sp.]